ncbi:MAG: hypothetical protein GPJ54_13040 [Candidatus Heimdallarchaeota archaeon]|nr:hypothetical protein [Candidatus Heimdallarchaeota archaeon]
MLRIKDFNFLISRWLVIIDAAISRVILLPAAMRLAGKWNWWLPKSIDPIQQDI